MFKDRKIFIGIAMFMIICGLSVLYIVATNNKFTEPFKRPELPSTATFNPDTNEYYDSSLVTWNPQTNVYELKNEQMLSINEGKEKSSITTVEEIINVKKTSTDAFDLALVKYAKEMQEYLVKHPELRLSSRWEVGQDEGGPLSIISELGVEGLPKIIEHISEDDPFAVAMMIAAEKICRTVISDINSSRQGVIEWKRDFQNKLINSKLETLDIVKKLNSNLIVNSEIEERTKGMGVFGLPYFYDEIINKSNKKLLKFAKNILPESRIKNNMTEDELEVALKKSKGDVDVLISLLEKE